MEMLVQDNYKYAPKVASSLRGLPWIFEFCSSFRPVGFKTVLL